jgi:hypothetical protein
MIKFFRKLRLEALSRKRVLKYLLYATGEIVLVVVGILIALQFNNWNEERKDEASLRRIHIAVKEDLKIDIASIDELTSSEERRDSIITKILERKITKEDYKSCEYCRRVIVGYPEFDLQLRGLNLLKNNSNQIDIDNEDLSSTILNFYNGINKEIEPVQLMLEEDTNANYFHFKNNVSWFSDYHDMTYNEEFVDYALTSADYYNRVSSFRILYMDVYLRYLNTYKEEALQLIEQIDKEYNLQP